MCVCVCVCVGMCVESSVGKLPFFIASPTQSSISASTLATEVCVCVCVCVCVGKVSIFMLITYRLFEGQGLPPACCMFTHTHTHTVFSFLCSSLSGSSGSSRA